MKNGYYDKRKKIKKTEKGLENRRKDISLKLYSSIYKLKTMWKKIQIDAEKFENRWSAKRF